MKYIIFVLFTILCLLNIFDVYSTNILLSKGYIELNPIVKYAMNVTTPLIGMCVLKGTFVVALFVISLKYYENKYLLLGLSFSVFFYLVNMVMFNLPQLIK